MLPAVNSMVFKHVMNMGNYRHKIQDVPVGIPVPFHLVLTVGVIPAKAGIYP